MGGLDKATRARGVSREKGEGEVFLDDARARVGACLLSAVLGWPAWLAACVLACVVVVAYYSW